MQVETQRGRQMKARASDIRKNSRIDSDDSSGPAMLRVYFLPIDHCGNLTCSADNGSTRYLSWFQVFFNAERLIYGEEEEEEEQEEEEEEEEERMPYCRENEE
ncbi:hypothetical protein EYF80_018615 [Liparis tanakae]|uniref:Uncharacterized protein n=1 Tax=Liparis tanakae TaxID=230148 RepID=A0A4Z2I0H9_9TELE|nr:hypothetical protein EYF80_018615 [Liparis tanakae]